MGCSSVDFNRACKFLYDNRFCVLSDYVSVCLQRLEVGSSSLWSSFWWRHMLTLLTFPELSLESSPTTRIKCFSRKSGTGRDHSTRGIWNVALAPPPLFRELSTRSNGFYNTPNIRIFFLLLFLVFRFGVDLQISDKLFVMDAGASNSKDMKLLRSHLQELRTNIISVSSASTLMQNVL